MKKSCGVPTPMDSPRQRSLGPALVRHRMLIQLAIDGAAWAVALGFATVVRHDFELSQVNERGLLALIPLAVLAQTVAGLGSGLYIGRWRFGSFEEVAALV